MKFRFSFNNGILKLPEKLKPKQKIVINTSSVLPVITSYSIHYTKLYENTYEALTTPQTLYVRIENDFGCYSITSFNLITRNCPPTVYNAVSVNNDGYNDDFFIDGLRDIFTDFKLEIYNRWGKLLWTGNNNVPNWDGYVKDGIGGNKAPEGTYFYILYLNDENYPDPLTGYLYLTY